ncbi:MAG: hypothetical protein Q9182_007498 [Xanthomendoza sp. 2 TL-2023]
MAFCAGTSDFVNYIKKYYSAAECTTEASPSTVAQGALIDRKLLEKFWGWLCQHPEIQIGANGKETKLSLSEVELRNANTAQHTTSHDEASPTLQVTKIPTPSKSSARQQRRSPANASSTVQGDTLLGRLPTEARIYASIERRWQAIAGHAFDPVKIPQLDFACLSIIAAHREQGIMQPELIRASGQDKRSVPQRTQRLVEGGYITKVPVFVNKVHTSKLTLKRYSKKLSKHDADVRTSHGPVMVLPSVGTSVDNPIDFLALHHQIFDILRATKLITCTELKDRIGVTGLRWPMRMLARHLRRLERIGCIKQVKAHPDTANPSSFLFRCVKYIRDPEGKEWNPVNFPPRGRAKPAAVLDNDDDAPSDEEDEYLAEEAQYLDRISGSQPLHSLKEVDRPIAQWSGDSTLSNLLYDLAHAAGLQGISTMEMKDRSMGFFVSRAVEHQLSRLVGMWQLSQPPHLRHLSIIRDATLTDGIPHYVHYTFPNFKALVDQGKASWDVVMTVTKEHKIFKEAAAIDAEPDLDENGFPTIADNLFQARSSLASLAECIQSAIVKVPSPAMHDPRVIPLKADDWILQPPGQMNKASRRKRSALSHPTNAVPKKRVRKPRKTDGLPHLVVSENCGRGRKIQSDGLPIGFNRLTVEQKRKVLKSQMAAKMYKKIKLMKEIEKRVAEGTDRYEATAAVFELAIQQYCNAERVPPYDVMGEIRSDTIAPSMSALQRSSEERSLNTAFYHGIEKLGMVSFRPSAAAHSRPLHVFEKRFVDNFFRARVQMIQNVSIQCDTTGAEPQGPWISVQPKAMTDGSSKPRRGPGRPPKEKKAAAPARARSLAVGSEKSTMTSTESTVQHEGVAQHYLPSVAAHTWPLVTHLHTNDKVPSLKRKRNPDEWTTSKKSKRLPKKMVPFETTTVARTASPRGSTNQVTSTQSYQQQLEGIARPRSGCYVGQEVKLSQPGRGALKRKSRLAVIKSSRIHDLPWFSIQDPMIKPVPPPPNHFQTAHVQTEIYSSMNIDQGSRMTCAPARRPLRPEKVPEIRASSNSPISSTPSEQVHVPSLSRDLENSVGTKRKRRNNDDSGKGSHPLYPVPKISASQTALSAIGVGRTENTAFPTRHEEQPFPCKAAYDPSPRQNLMSEPDAVQKLPSPTPPITKASIAFIPQVCLSQNHHGHIDHEDSAKDDIDRGQFVVAENDQEELPNLGHVVPQHIFPSQSPGIQPPSTKDDAESAKQTQQLDLNDTQMSGVPECAELAASSQALKKMNGNTPCDRAAIQPVLESNDTSSKNLPSEIAGEGHYRPTDRGGLRRMKLQGGTVAAHRRKIITDIVEKYEGIYPGVFELGPPFKEAWQKYGYSGSPETSTLRAVVQALCDSGLLQQLTFAFKDPRGIVVTKTMITKVDISPTDPRVLAMQTTIKNMHPHSYVPQEVEIPDQARDPFSRTKGHVRMRTAKDLEVDEDRVQLKRIPAYVEKYEIKRKSIEDRKLQKGRKMGVLREIAAEGTVAHEAVYGTLGSISTAHARNRLFTLARRTMSKEPQRKVDRLTNSKSRPSMPSLDPSAQNTIRKPLDFSRILTASNFDGALAAQLLDEQSRQTEMDFTPAAIERRLPTYRPPGRPSRWQYNLPKPGMNEASECMTLRPVGKSLVRCSNSLDIERHSPQARQQLYTIMEPEHFFHPATGTFAVNFSRSRTVNQICHKYHWQGPHVKDFIEHVDDLMVCELNTKGLEDAQYSDWPMINYTFPHDHRTANGHGYSIDARWYFKNQGFKGYEPIDVVPIKRKRKQNRPLEPFKTRRMTTVAKLSNLAKAPAKGDGNHKAEKRVIKKRERATTADEARKILLAVIVVRTLTGGVERHIDWVLVTKVFEGEHDQAYLQKRWPRVLQAHKIQAQQLQANFQDIFLRAYQDGLVPPLDYDNLQAYDWAWIVNWTIENIDTPNGAALDLPSHRNRLEDMFHLSTADDNNLHSYYELESPASALRREMELHKKAGVQPLTSKMEEASGTDNGMLELVKTYIRANIVTKAETYNPQSARDKLARFDPHLIDQALKEMLGDRVIMTENKGRLIPGRNYDLNEQYLKPLSKRGGAARLLNAPTIKREMDQALAEKGEMIVSERADDTSMMAMQNMQAHGRIALVAKNPPMKKMGLTDNGSYKMRLLDTRKLHFDVGIQATDTYITGNPLLPLPRPPCSHLESSMEKIPLWYDINDDLIPELWDLAVAATMSVLVIRPGITARVLEPTLRPSLALWEVQTVLDWMVEARVARKVGDEYTPEEWWWLCLDSGKGPDGAAQEEETDLGVREGQGEVEMGNT